MTKEQREFKLEETKMILDAYSKTIETLDKQLLLISTGSLVLSTSYLNSVILLKTASWLPLYLISVVLFVLAIIIGLIGHFISSKVIARLLEDENIVDHDSIDIPEILNILNLIFTILGLLTLVVFSIKNII